MMPPCTWFSAWLGIDDLAADIAGDPHLVHLDALSALTVTSATSAK